MIIAIDFDGVLTDGKVYINNRGKQFYAVHSRDNAAIAQLLAAGHVVVIVTNNESPAIYEYAKARKCSYIRTNIKNVACDIAIGDSMQDLPMFQNAKLLSIAPSDAPKAVKRIVSKVAEVPGGHGVIDWLINEKPELFDL
jgi:3-deoxy-D-manno-octulosonate 8-phosphate phosphatase (KDO 8-P phosphatase)